MAREAHGADEIGMLARDEPGREVGVDVEVGLRGIRHRLAPLVDRRSLPASLGAAPPARALRLVDGRDRGEQTRMPRIASCATAGSRPQWRA
ncbi:hypothetical protein GCM10009761_23190 [Agromyces terreus]